MNEIYFLTFCRSILKIGKPGIDIILLSPTSIHSLYSDFLTNPRNDLFPPLKPESNPGSCVVFNCYIPLISFDLEKSLALLCLS